MSILDEFNKHVGLIIKDPERLTTDMDPAAEIISDLARKHGLHLVFIKAGQPEDEPFMADVESVFVNITKDDVPEDKSWGWRVESFNIG